MKRSWFDEGLTNAEKIREMSVEELAKWILSIQEDNCSCCGYYSDETPVRMCKYESADAARCLCGHIDWLRLNAMEEK